MDYDLASQQPSASLAGTTLDVNTHLPPATASGDAPVAKSAGAKTETAATPHPKRLKPRAQVIRLKPWKTLNVAITLTFEKLLLPGHVLENVDLALTGKDGILSLSKSNLVMDGEKKKRRL